LFIDAAALNKVRQRLGPLLETFALQELRRQASWHTEPIDFFHYRDRDDLEVDIVLEQGSFAVAGVEVKAAAPVVGALRRRRF
jgi:predicted AAA+ superfamily ATPase